MRYCPNTCAVELTVDELCALAHKSGHLDARYPKRALQAVDPRKWKLPKEAGREECVPVRNTLTHNGITYTVEGTAHAVCGKDLIEQIKPVKKLGGNAGDSFTRLRALG